MIVHLNFVRNMIHITIFSVVMSPNRALKSPIQNILFSLFPRDTGVIFDNFKIYITSLTNYLTVELNK